MGISSLGAGSGLDLEGLLSGLMKAEQAPLVALQRKEASFRAQFSAYGALKGALSSVQTAAAALIPAKGVSAADKYMTTSASVADAAIASATASAKSVAGTYDLEVITLAKNQRLVAAPLEGDATSTIPKGTLKLELGTLSTDGSSYQADAARTKTITIDDTNNTLGGLRDAINKSKAGVTATIVNGKDASGNNVARLMLTSDATGRGNVMRLSSVDDNGDQTALGEKFGYDPVAGSGGMSQDITVGGRAASNAEYTINGVRGTNSTNTITDAVEGVTLKLTKETESGKPTSFSVSKNTTASLNAALTSFVGAYNESQKAMKDLGAYDPKTKQAGPLVGNSALRTSQNEMRRLVSDTRLGGSSAYQRLSDIGVSFNKDGTLSLDGDKLNKAITADYDSVAALVTKLGKDFDIGMNRTQGAVTVASQGTDRLIADTMKQEKVVSDRLMTIESRYRKQFVALDATLAQMKQMGARLSQQLASIAAAKK